MSEKVLLPCPNFGREAKHYSVRCWNPEEEEWIPNFWHRVICNNCGTQTKSFYTEAEAVEAWNKRAEPERKKGEWVRRKDADCWECSECHAVLENSDIGNHNFYYCYHCGSDMMDLCGYMNLEKANYE